MKKRTSNVSRRVVSLLMSMVLTLTLVTPAAFAEGIGAYANGEGTAVTTPADIATQEGEDTSVSVAQRTVTVKQYHANEAYEVKIVVGVEEGVEKLDTTYTIDADTKTVTLKLTTDGYDGEPVYIKTALDDVLVTEGENQTPALTKDTPELEYALPEDGDVTLYYGTQEHFNAPATQRTVTVEQYRANEAYDVKLVVGVEEDGTTEKLDTTYTINADTKTVTLKLTTADYAGEPVYIKTALDDVLVTEGENPTPALTKETLTLEYALPEDGDVTLYYGTQEDFVSAWYTSVTDDKYTIRTAEELANFAQLVNSNNSFSGKTLKLTADIDLGGNEWTPIGGSACPFRGTFDGNSFGITGLKVTNNSENGFAGLFGDVQGSTIPETISALSALALYRDKENVAAAIEAGLTYLSSVQLADGSFECWGDTPNGAVTLSMLSLMDKLDISIDDERFVKNGNTVADAMRTFYVDGVGFISDFEVDAPLDGLDTLEYKTTMGVTSTVSALTYLQAAENGKFGPDGKGNSVFEIVGSALKETPLGVILLAVIIVALLAFGMIRRYRRIKKEQ